MIPCQSPELELTAKDLVIRVLVPVLFTIFTVVGFLGNLLVIVVVLRNMHMRNTTNLLIISLAMADLAFIVFCVPFTALYYVVGTWLLGSIMCKIFYYVTFLTAYLSVYTLILMSFDRYLAVVYPIQSRTWRTQANTITAVAILWFFFMLAHVPLLLDAEVIPSVDLSSGCVRVFCTNSRLVTLNTTTLITEDNGAFGQVYFSLFFLFGYALPFVAICVLYGMLIHRLLFGRTSHMARSEESSRSRRRVTVMVVTIIAVFGACWLPIHFIFLWQYFSKDPDALWFRVAHIIANCLVYANSSINPILYTFLCEHFRKAFLKMLGCNAEATDQDPRETQGNGSRRRQLPAPTHESKPAAAPPQDQTRSTPLLTIQKTMNTTHFVQESTADS